MSVELLRHRNLSPVKHMYSITAVLIMSELMRLHRRCSDSLCSYIRQTLTFISECNSISLDSERHHLVNQLSPVNVVLLTWRLTDRPRVTEVWLLVSFRPDDKLHISSCTGPPCLNFSVCKVSFTNTHRMQGPVIYSFTPQKPSDQHLKPETVHSPLNTAEYQLMCLYFYSFTACCELHCVIWTLLFK